MITFISGGSDSLKLIRAFRNLLYDDEIAVIANTSDCIWSDGNILCPDLDDIMYLFSGNLNTSKWTGIKSDTYSTFNMLKKISPESKNLPIGEKTRAVSIARSNIFREGGNLTESTEYLCKYFGITARIVPATDNRYSAYAEIDNEIHSIPEFREIYMNHPDAEFRASVRIDSKKIPEISAKVKEIIEISDAVIIGPGRINTTLSPVFACRNFRNLLKNSFVISVLPCLPADYSPEKYPSFHKMLNVYQSISDIIIQDIKEEREIPGTVRLNTRLKSVHNAESLAWEIMSVIRSH